MAASHRDGQTVEIRLRNEADITATRNLITDQLPDLQAQVLGSGSEQRIRASIKPEALRKVQEQALKQNITTLHNRINELGVAEPVIQQQGLDRIVGAVARRAGHRQGQGHLGPHRHAGAAHGG